MMLISAPGYSQNTKGDRPASSREGRFKVSQKKPKRSESGSKRIKTKGRSPSSSGYSNRGPRGSEKAGKPLRPTWNVKAPQERQRAWEGDISGRKLRNRNQSSSTPNVHPQQGRYVRRSIPDREGRQNVTSGRPTRVRSATGSVRNVYTQRDRRYVHNNSTKPRDTQRPVSNRETLARLRTLETKQKPPGRKVRVVPRSASHAFIRNKSINVYATFKRPKKKGERAVTTDIAGRKLRTKNFQSAPPGYVGAPRVNTGRNRQGERPYRGPSGSYRSASGKGRGAWVGDITGRRVGNRSSKRSIEGTPSVAGRPRSATRTGRVGSGLPGRTPGIGAQGISNYRGNQRFGGGFRNQGEEYSGLFKGRRRATGGGSVSGRRWNNNGNPLTPRTPGIGASGIGNYRGDRRFGRGFRNQGEEFSGGLRGGRPSKGGGSVSGRVWNNRGSSLPPRQPGMGKIPAYPGKMRFYKGQRGFGDQGEEFSGNYKTRRPAKGGGSVSGRLWNNRESAIEGRHHSTRGFDFSGNIKSKRPEKGGGSVSGKLWNNRETAIEGRHHSTRGLDYSGNLKGKRPQKGGGSVSGKLWNNEEKPIEGRRPGTTEGLEFGGNIKTKRPGKPRHEGGVPAQTPPEQAREVSGYPGKHRMFELQPGFRDQGEEFSGSVRLGRKPYVQNKKAHEESILKRRQDKKAFAADDMHVKVKRRDYVRNKNVTEDAMLKLKPTKVDAQVSNLQVKVKQYNYIRNKSSAEDALKVREPGKAFARATDYQGNIKMQRHRFYDRNRDLHPDARFVKINKNNVKEERDAVTNLKLWWARLFKKQETQPDHLKEKLKKPRYDKGEQGMWYD